MSKPLRTKASPDLPEPTDAVSEEEVYWKITGATDNTIMATRFHPEWRRVNLSHYRKRRVHGTAGSKCGTSKLQESDIPVICELYMRGENQADIGKRFGVTKYTVSLIIQNKTWKHVERPDASGPKTNKNYTPRGERHTKSKLTPVMVLSIRNDYRAGLSSRDLGKKYGVSFHAIRDILTRKCWAHVPDPGPPIVMRVGPPHKTPSHTIEQIKTMHTSGVGTKLISKTVGLHQTTVQKILKRLRSLETQNRNL